VFILVKIVIPPVRRHVRRSQITYKWVGEDGSPITHKLFGKGGGEDPGSCGNSNTSEVLPG